MRRKTTEFMKFAQSKGTKFFEEPKRGRRYSNKRNINSID